MSKKNLLFLLCLVSLIFLCYLFFYQKTYHTCINVNFASTNVPMTNVEIEGVKYCLEIDIGSKYPLTLHDVSLAKIKEKKKLNDSNWKDFKGNSYSTCSYKLSQVVLKDIIVKNVIVSTSSRNYENNSMIYGDPETDIDFSQSIGRSFLDKFKLLLDFKNSRIFVSNDIKRLKTLGFDIANFKKIPMENGRGVVLQIETDFGIKKFFIDTGSTVTSLRKTDLLNQNKSKHNVPISTTKKFIIGGEDFGNQDFYLLEITPELNEIDGILGMDFLKKHVVYIDFPGKVVYIE